MARNSTPSPHVADNRRGKPAMKWKTRLMMGSNLRGGIPDDQFGRGVFRKIVQAWI
jgi:hypothetical protein